MTKELSKKYLKSGIFELWHDKKFSDFKADNDIRKFCEDYVNTIPHDKGIAFVGINGLGKTMLMNLVLKGILDSGKDKTSVFVIPYWELTKEYIKSWKGEGRYEMLKKVQYLGIDEIGKSFETTYNSKELGVNALEFLLTYRIQRKKPTFITTNVKLEDFRDRYNDSIASKLNEACTIIEFKHNNKFNDDYRTNKLSEVL